MRTTALLTLALSTLAGCTTRQVTIYTPASLEPSNSPVSGVWGAVNRAVDADGDERIDRHEIQLVAHGQRLSGFWSHSTTWVSRDGRTFRCGGSARYEQRSRAYLEGALDGRHAKVRVVGAAAGPSGAGCPAPLAPPTRCDLERRADRLVGHCGKVTLALNLRLDRPIPVALALGRRGSVTGVWTWHHRSRDPQKDLKIEDEVWHLLQRGDEVYGYYDRLVVVRSADGRRFMCNHGLAYSNLARFRVRGHIKDGRMILKELDYRARPGACETGRRVLDTYQGTLAREGSLIRLRWKRGAQLLYKRRH